MTPSASAFCCASAPAKVIGLMAPAKVKGVTITHWPKRAMVMSPSSIGPSTRSGELVLTTLASPGWRRISASSRPRLSRLISNPSTTRSAPMQLGPQILSVRVVCR